MSQKYESLTRDAMSLHSSPSVKDTNSDEERPKTEVDYVKIARARTKAGMTPPQLGRPLEHRMF